MSFTLSDQEAQLLHSLLLNVSERYAYTRDDIWKDDILIPSQAYVIAPRERRYLYVYLPQSVLFTVENWANLQIPASTFHPLPFREGTRLTPLNLSGQINILLFHTDQAIVDNTIFIASNAGTNIGSVQLLAQSSNGVDIGAVETLSDYPLNATITVATSGNVANAAATASLPAAGAGKFTWITGFEVVGTGATAASIVDVTVGPLAGGVTFHYELAAVAGATLQNTPLIVQFPKAIRAQLSNQAIAVTCPALGAGNTNNAVNAHGYQL